VVERKRSDETRREEVVSELLGALSQLKEAERTARSASEEALASELQRRLEEGLGGEEAHRNQGLVEMDERLLGCHERLEEYQAEVGTLALNSTPSGTEFAPSGTQFAPSGTEFTPSGTAFTSCGTEFTLSGTIRCCGAWTTSTR
jgi:hypothetical protein